MLDSSPRHWGAPKKAAAAIAPRNFITAIAVALLLVSVTIGITVAIAANAVQ
jgi:hypothetical protein